MVAILACVSRLSLPLLNDTCWPKNSQDLRIRWVETPVRGGRKLMRMRMVGAWSWRTNAAAAATATATATAKEEEAAAAAPPSLFSLKKHLLSTVAGLDRGLVANEADAMTADSAAKKLEASGGIVDLSTGLDKLQGRWRLIYSSAFASGSLGGLRPGPPTGRLPLTLGQVFQRIDIVGKEFDNIVNLQIGTPWPLPPIEVTAKLAHSFELIGRASIRIIFERTIIQTAGSLSQLPPVELPQLPEFLRPPSSIRSGDFEVTFVDDNLRITRGDRGELRVFLKS